MDSIPAALASRFARFPIWKANHQNELQDTIVSVDVRRVFE
jgi:hypothetical protein